MSILIVIFVLWDVSISKLVVFVGLILIIIVSIIELLSDEKLPIPDEIKKIKQINRNKRKINKKGNIEGYNRRKDLRRL